MKKQFFVLYSFLIFYFVLISVLKGGFSQSFLAFWIGGVIGIMLPDIDHFIYIYFLRPHELTSQRAMSSVQKGEVMRALELLYETRSERTRLIFHTATFQIIFLGFCLFIISSSSGLFGKGLVLSFAIHLVVDQIIDYLETNSLANWFYQIKVQLDEKKSKYFLTANIVAIILLGILM